ncbi:MAG TPA: SGNH/GDSL hydrolase family protein [Pseudolabrys sp.]|nr:SGNH/GDSL hydrolase family protein [Pseudolabrys sp.]
MRSIGFVYRSRSFFALAAFIAVAALPVGARGESTTPSCDAPLSIVRFTNPLTRVAEQLANNNPLIIVAIGSSSTAGVGASSPAASYPSRLAFELMHRFPNRPITILNRGIGGEEVDDMLKRFDTDVLAAKPDLVLWQLGTNSVIRDDVSNNYNAAIHQGIAKIRAIGADVILIDPQFTPKVIAKLEAARMVELIATVAKLENINRFPRFDMMRRWYDVDRMAFKTFVSPDGLHMNDWSYGCLARGLGLAIAEAAQRPTLSAKAAGHTVH